MLGCNGGSISKLVGSVAGLALAYFWHGMLLQIRIVTIRYKHLRIVTHRTVTGSQWSYCPQLGDAIGRNCSQWVLATVRSWAMLLVATVRADYGCMFDLAPQSPDKAAHKKTTTMENMIRCVFLVCRVILCELLYLSFESMFGLRGNQRFASRASSRHMCKKQPCSVSGQTSRLMKTSASNTRVCIDSRSSGPSLRLSSKRSASR